MNLEYGSPSLGKVWNLLESATCLVTVSTGLFGRDHSRQEAHLLQNETQRREEPPSRRRARAAKLPFCCCPRASRPRAGVVRLLWGLVCLPRGSSSQQFSADSWDLTKQVYSLLMTPHFLPMPLGQLLALPVSSHVSGHSLSLQMLSPCILLPAVNAGLHMLE